MKISLTNFDISFRQSMQLYHILLHRGNPVKSVKHVIIENDMIFDLA